MKSNPYKHEKYNFNKSKDKKKRSNIRNTFDEGLLFSTVKEMKKRKSIFSMPRIPKEKEIYIENPNRKSRPPWLLPILFVIGISLIVFWVGPFTMKAISKLVFNNKDNTQSVKLVYNTGDYLVVSKQYADILEKPDLLSLRKTQVLYNQILKIIDKKTYGYYQVELEDKTRGYIMSENVTNFTESIEPNMYQIKIIVLSKSKRVMSHSSNGSIVVEIYMGTVLYSNYQGDGVYRVILPDHKEGWVSASGVLKLNSGQEVKISSAKGFYSTVISFNDTTYIDNGITQMGASSDGIAYIAAKVNGITIPRDKQLQLSVGKNIPLEYDKDTGLFKYDNLNEGDLIFFKSDANPAKVGEMGIVMGYGQVLMSRNSKSSVKILLLDDYPNLTKSVLAVKRMF